jgi:hypothetical protein
MKTTAFYPNAYISFTLNWFFTFWALTWTLQFLPTGTSPHAAATSQLEDGPRSLDQTRASKEIRQTKKIKIRLTSVQNPRPRGSQTGKET